MVKEYAATESATGGILPSKSHKTTVLDVTSFSSGGPDHHSHGDLLEPDIPAPGEAVPAGTVPGGLSGYPGSFGFMSGTSMASPHMAGLATLLKQFRPRLVADGGQVGADDHGDDQGREGRPRRPPAR